MKCALILHGWPQYRIERYFLSNYFRRKGYKVLTPNMFARDYIFSSENVCKDVSQKLASDTLDVIVGISMGGLIVPTIAKSYPHAKLIFIGTGPKLKSKLKNFNRMVTLVKFILKTGIPNVLIKLPDSMLILLYKAINPFTGDPSRKEKYEKDMKKNIKFIKSISINEEKEIINFVTEVNNTSILRNLKNSSLIFSGNNDLLMPKERGMELKSLLKNSKLIISNGSHFDSFTKRDLYHIDNFLED